MKYLYYIFLIVVVGLVFFGCAIQKTIVVTPCETESVDDSLYVRELGHGISYNLQSARDMAIMTAKKQFQNRFCDSIGRYVHVVELYNDSLYLKTNDSTALLQYSIKYFGQLSNTNKECEGLTIDSDGRYHSFITLSISRPVFEKLLENVYIDYTNRISNISVNNK